MKKNNLKPFLAFSSVFLLVGSIFISALNKPLNIAAFDVNDNPEELIYLDAVDWDYIRFIHSNEDDVLQEVIFDYTGTSFFNSSGRSSSTMYYELYASQGDFAYGNFIVSEFNYNAGFLLDGLSVYPYYTQFSLQPDLGHLIFSQYNFHANEMIIPLSLVDNIYRFSSFYLINMEDEPINPNTRTNIFYCKIQFTINYYDELSQTIRTHDVFYLYDEIPYYNDTFLMIPFKIIENYTQYAVKEYLSLSNVLLTFSFNNDYQDDSVAFFRLQYNSYLVQQAEIVHYSDIFNDSMLYVPDLDQADFSNWIANGLGGFLSFEIMPGLSLAVILAVCIAIPLLIAFLKLFAGG